MNACIAQLVEHLTGNEEVMSSTLIVGSKEMENNMKKNQDRMYIVVREKALNEHFELAILSIAHASAAACLDWKNDFEFDAWAYDSFRKCLCLANEKEWAKLKGLEIEKRVMTESALDDKEMSIVFKPRAEWPKMMKFLRLFSMKNLNLEWWE